MIDIRADNQLYGKSKISINPTRSKFFGSVLVASNCAKFGLICFVLSVRIAIEICMEINVTRFYMKKKS